MNIAFIGLCAACGKISDARDALAFKDVAEANFEVREQFKDMPGTAFRVMPTTGSAKFDGAARIFIDPVEATQSDNLLIYGDVGITANFAGGTVTGDIRNMQGATDISEQGADTFDVTGTIRIGGQSSSIGAVDGDPDSTRPNDWAANYAGTLGLPDGDYTVRGDFDGQFVGTNPNSSQGLRGVFATDEQGTAAHNGQGIPTYVEIGAGVTN